MTIRKSRRFSVLVDRPINRETFIEAWPEAGLSVADSPYDPEPSLRLENGCVVEMDGVAQADFYMIDRLFAAHVLDPSVAEDAMATPSRTLVDINVTSVEVRRLVLGCTSAKLVQNMRHLNVLEMMMGLAKMRVPLIPSNQPCLLLVCTELRLLAAGIRTTSPQSRESHTRNRATASDGLSCISRLDFTALWENLSQWRSRTAGLRSMAVVDLPPNLLAYPSDHI